MAPPRKKRLRKTGAFRPVHFGKTIPYVDRERLNKNLARFFDGERDIRVIGFLRPQIELEADRSFELLNRKELLEAIQAVWKASLPMNREAALGYIVTIQLVPQAYQEMVAARIPIADNFTYLICRELRILGQKIHLGEHLSYLLRIDDGPNEATAKLLLFPATNRGTLLNFPKPDTTVSEKRVNIDWRVEIKNRVENQGADFYRSTVTHPIRPSFHSADVLAQNRLITQAAHQLCEIDIASDIAAKSPVEEVDLWLRTQALRRRFLESPDNNRRVILEGAYQERQGRFDQLSIDEAKIRLRSQTLVQAKIRQSLYDLIGAVMPWQIGAAFETNERTLIKDFFRFKTILCRDHRSKWSFPVLATTIPATNADPAPAAAARRLRLLDQRLRDFRKLQKDRQVEIEKNVSRQSAARREQLAIFGATRLQFDTTDLTIVDCRHRSQGSRPLYLLRFHDWTSMSRPTPVLLRRLEEMIQERAAKVQDAWAKAVRNSEPRAPGHSPGAKDVISLSPKGCHLDFTTTMDIRREQSKSCSDLNRERLVSELKNNFEAIQLLVNPSHNNRIVRKAFVPVYDCDQAMERIEF